MVVGDLNAHPQTLDIAAFRTLVPGLTDTWQQLRPNDPGYTSNSPDNAISAAGEGSMQSIALQLASSTHMETVASSKMRCMSAKKTCLVCNISFFDDDRRQDPGFRRACCNSGGTVIWASGETVTSGLLCRRSAQARPAGAHRLRVERR